MRFPAIRLSRSTITTGVSWILYLVLILLAIPPVISWIHRIIFFLYAVFIFWILYPTLKRGEPCDMDAATPTRRIWIALLIFSGLFLVASRLYMFIRYGATPLGYDTGFYWQYFNLITSLGTSIGAVGSNIAYVMWFPFYHLGLSAISTIHSLHLLNQLTAVGALYFLVRSLRPLNSKLTSAVVLILFALSINQFMAFWWMFYKQSLALPFLLLATGLFLRRSWIAIPMAAFGAALHLQSAAPFAIALLIFFLYSLGYNLAKKHPLDRELLYIGLAGAITGILLILLKGPRDLLAYLEYFRQYGGLASNARDWEVQQVKGLFLPFSTFRLNTLFYLPFALTGVLTMRSWFFGKTSTAYIMIVPIILFSSTLLATFPFLYQNRMLIILDIMLILFAAYPIIIFIKKLIGDRTGQIMLGLLLVGLILFTSRVIWNNPPQIYPEEAREIKAITQLRKPDDYAMALTSLYTPWVFAYTGFEQTIAPGWLTWDKWDLKMWQEFWNGSSNTRRLELLSIYGNHDIYMFAGTHFNMPPNLKKFLETDPHFTKISPHIWKYSP